MQRKQDLELKGWRLKAHKIIFESDTSAGRIFDMLLVVAIVISVLIVFLETVPSINLKYGPLLISLEWFFTILFTLEYFFRIVSLKKPFLYVKSFYGIIDLLSVLPTYLSILFTGTGIFLVLRIFRLLRLFRTLKLIRYVSQAKELKIALKSSKEKIIVFLVAVISVVLIAGSLLYFVEGPENGFTSIPTSVYWSVVTVTTVGYGDMVPHTALGKFIASCLMIVGFGIIAVPAGIFSAEMIKQKKLKNMNACDDCGKLNSLEAHFCNFCGSKIK